MASSTITKNPTTSKVIKSVVVVVRHGERLDYVMRDVGDNWIPTSKEPWNPPLTENGKQQSKALGEALPEILQNLNLPSTMKIGAIYTSPFLRCRQTAAGLLLGSSSSSFSSSLSSSNNEKIKIRVELGLAESINENFFRSWAIEGTNGTWGYMKKEKPTLHPSELHPASKLPVQESGILNWKNAKKNEEDYSTNDNLNEMMDYQYVSTTTIDIPFSLYPPNFESFKMQRNRMADTMKKLASLHPNEIIILVSHGGPVTHLYESLTGNKWDVHGVSKYCCYSIYEQTISEEGYDNDNNNHTAENDRNDHTNDTTWKPLIVNQVLGGREEEKTIDENNKQKDKDNSPKEFTWA